MERLTRMLEDDHVLGEECFAAAENAAQTGDWPACRRSIQKLQGNITAHFAAEEGILFPAFETASGMSSGPTEVMRHEHTHIRALLDQLIEASAMQDAELFAAAAESLIPLIGQHNLKEQNILYPMCDRLLQSQQPVLDAALRQRLESASCATAA